MGNKTKCKFLKVVLRNSHLSSVVSLSDRLSIPFLLCIGLMHIRDGITKVLQQENCNYRDHVPTPYITNKATAFPWNPQEFTQLTISWTRKANCHFKNFIRNLKSLTFWWNLQSYLLRNMASSRAHLRLDSWWPKPAQLSQFLPGQSILFPQYKYLSDKLCCLLLRVDLTK